MRAPAATTVGFAPGVPGASVLPNAAGSLAAPVAGASGAVVPGTRRVHLRITPSTAIVIVDGVVLPRGTDTIAKPQDGTTDERAREGGQARGHHRDVDSATPDEVEVTLVPNARPLGAANGQAAQGGGAATQGSGAGGGTRPRPAGGSGRDAGAPVIDAPPNPYE